MQRKYLKNYYFWYVNVGFLHVCVKKYQKNLCVVDGNWKILPNFAAV